MHCIVHSMHCIAQFLFFRVRMEPETLQMWMRVHVSLVKELVRAQAQRYHEWHAHARKWCMQDWHNTEAELTRERGLWGPERPSVLDKFELDVTEGPCRVRKKLIPNPTFYQLYPYRPQLDAPEAVSFCIVHSMHCIALCIRCIALCIQCIALCIRCIALCIRCIALCIRCIALCIRCIALCIRCIALRIRCIALRIRCIALRIRCIALRIRCIAFNALCIVHSMHCIAHSMHCIQCIALCIVHSIQPIHSSFLRRPSEPRSPSPWTVDSSTSACASEERTRWTNGSLTHPALGRAHKSRRSSKKRTLPAWWICQQVYSFLAKQVLYNHFQS